MEEPEEEEGGSAEPAPLSVVPSTGKAHTAPRRHPPSHILELGADGPHVVAPRRGVSSWRVHHNEHGDWVLSSWDSQGNMLQECLLPQAASESWTLMNGHDPGSAHIWSEGSAAPMHCATFMANHASSASAQCSAPPKPPPGQKDEEDSRATPSQWCSKACKAFARNEIKFKVFWQGTIESSCERGKPFQSES